MFGFGTLVTHTLQNKGESDVLTKVGVKVIHNLSDEIYHYKSALI